MKGRFIVPKFLMEKQVKKIKEADKAAKLEHRERKRQLKYIMNYLSEKYA